MIHQHATIEDTVYFWFASNDTSGSGGDGATPLFDVREAGAAASAIPLLSGTPTLLTHANYPAGCHEIAVAATTGNGFAADDTFSVFCTLAIDAQNPTGFVGSCTLTPLAKASVCTETRLAELAAANLPADIDTLLTRIVGTLAAGTHNPATAAQIAVLSDWINGGRLDLILDIIAADTTTDIPALIATAQTDLDTITGADGVTLASTQGAVTWGAITLSVSGATPNIDFNGSGTGDVFAFTRSGSGGLYNTAYIADLQAVVAAAITAYAPATEVKQDVIDGIVDAILLDTAELQINQGNWLTATGFATEAKQDAADIEIAELTTQGDTNETALTNVQSRLPAALVSGKMDSDALAVGGSTDGATRLGKATQANVYGTIGSGSTTTSLVTSSLDPSAAAIDQFKGKIVTFDANTTTVNLRGQSTDVTSNTSGGVLTVTALTTAAVSGDIFVIT